MADKSYIYITAKNGSDCRIEGDDAAVTAVIKACQKAGARYNREVCTWDFGFYPETPKPRRTKREA